VSLSRWDAATDGNQKAIIRGLRQAGFTVEYIRKPCDLVVGSQGVNTLLEIKRNEKAPLTMKQINFEFEWRGQYAVVWTLPMAVNAVLENTQRCQSNQTTKVTNTPNSPQQ